MILKESTIKILSDKKAKQESLHVKHIARHILTATITFFDGIEVDIDALKKRVIRIFTNDANKKKEAFFKKVINPKTGKHRRGYYQLKLSRSKK
jgi:hypothetical protein